MVFQKLCSKPQPSGFAKNHSFIKKIIKLKSASHFLMHYTQSLQEFIFHQNAITARLRHSKFEKK